MEPLIQHEPHNMAIPFTSCQMSLYRISPMSNNCSLQSFVGICRKLTEQFVSNVTVQDSARFSTMTSNHSSLQSFINKRCTLSEQFVRAVLPVCQRRQLFSMIVQRYSEPSAFVQVVSVEAGMKSGRLYLIGKSSYGSRGIPHDRYSFF